jgi:hypothetical protein
MATSSDGAGRALPARLPLRFARYASELTLSMIPEKPAPDAIRVGHRFSEKIMLQQ